MLKRPKLLATSRKNRGSKDHDQKIFLKSNTLYQYPTFMALTALPLTDMNLGKKKYRAL
jgi:hypothetical protein